LYYCLVSLEPLSAQGLCLLTSSEVDLDPLVPCRFPGGPKSSARTDNVKDRADVDLNVAFTYERRPGFTCHIIFAAAPSSPLQIG
jgi:hypothetical protein